MREEARRLWVQALEDLETAKVLLKNKRYYASAFFSQQAAEKALKALYIETKREITVKTHNLVELLDMLGVNDEELREAAMELNPEYVITRYPDAANGIPAQLYNENIANRHLSYAVSIIDFCRRGLGLG